MKTPVERTTLSSTTETIKRTSFCLDKHHVQRAVEQYIQRQIASEILGACTHFEISFDDYRHSPEMCVIVVFEGGTE